MPHTINPSQLQRLALPQQREISWVYTGCFPSQVLGLKENTSASLRGRRRLKLPMFLSWDINSYKNLLLQNRRFFTVCVFALLQNENINSYKSNFIKVPTLVTISTLNFIFFSGLFWCSSLSHPMF